jgi:hypothetical protein
MLKMGMYTPEALQTPPARSVFLDVRDDNFPVIADHDMGDPTLAVDQKTNLAADFKRKQGNCLAELR